MKQLCGAFLLVAYGVTFLSGQSNNKNLITADINYVTHLAFERGGVVKTMKLTKSIGLFDWGTNTVSDDNGSSFFFCNSVSMYNKGLGYVENGEDIAYFSVSSGGPYQYNVASQYHNGVIGLPPIDQQKKYFHFFYLQDTMESVTQAQLLCYAKIDGLANNGLGKVVEKKKVLVRSSYLESIAACRHANGRDWWIVLPEHSSPNEKKYYIFLLTPQGLNDPKIQNFDVSYDYSVADAIANSCFSPNGNWFLDNDEKYGKGANLFSFDRCTGSLSMPKFLSHGIDGEWGGGAAFSPNSRFVYLIPECFCDYVGRVIQYDLWASDVQGSKIEVYSKYQWDTIVPYNEFQLYFESASLLSNGKIGIASGWYQDKTDNYYHVIDQPNLKGTDCRFQLSKMSLGKVLPYGIGSFPNFRLGPVDGSSCDTLDIDNKPYADFTQYLPDSTGLEVVFTDNSAYEPTTWHWDFGDGTTSADTSPVHNYLLPGTYNVCLTVCNINACDTFCQPVTVPYGFVSTSEVGQSTGQIRIEPNPNDGSFYILIDDKGIDLESEFKLLIYNSIGQKVTEVTIGIGENPISILNYQNGFYYAIISKENNLISAEKILIIH